MRRRPRTGLPVFGVIVTLVSLLASTGSAAPAVQHSHPELSVSPTLNVTIDASVTVGTVPLSVSFNASASGGYAPYFYNWSFGDGSAPASSSTADHVFVLPGTYVTTVDVNDVYGEPGNASVAIVVAAPPLVAELTATPSTFAVGNVTILEANATGGTPPYSYNWTGLPMGCVAGDLQSIRCQPTVPGGFSIRVTISDAQHVTQQSTAGLVVTGTVPPSGGQNSGGGGSPTLSTFELTVVGVAVVAGAAAGLVLGRRRRARVR